MTDIERLSVSFFARNTHKAFPRVRVPILPREAAAIVMLRRKFGYSIQCLATAFSRSRSKVHQILKFNSDIGNLRYVDLRKLPRRIKRLQSARQQRELWSFLDLWTSWISGSEEEPP